MATADLDALLAAAQRDPADDSAAMSEIVERFDDLAKRIGRSVSKEPFTQDVCANSARIELVKAVRRHTLGTRGFASYARMSMTFGAQREAKALQRERRRDVFVEIDAPEVNAEMMRRALPATRRCWDTAHVECAVRDLGADQRQLVQARYFDDASERAIAARRGTSTSAISQRLATIHRILRTALAA